MKGFDGAGPVCGLQAEAPDLVKTGNTINCQKHWQGFQLWFRQQQRHGDCCLSETEA